MCTVQTYMRRCELLYCLLRLCPFPVFIRLSCMSRSSRGAAAGWRTLGGRGKVRKLKEDRSPLRPQSPRKHELLTTHLNRLSRRYSKCTHFEQQINIFNPVPLLSYRWNWLPFLAQSENLCANAFCIFPLFWPYYLTLLNNVIKCPYTYGIQYI